MPVANAASPTIGDIIERERERHVGPCRGSGSELETKIVLPYHEDRAPELEPVRMRRVQSPIAVVVGWLLPVSAEPRRLGGGQAGSPPT